jgi:hypothetical protein
MKKQVGTALVYVSVGLFLGMMGHAWFYRTDLEDFPKQPKAGTAPETADLDAEDPPQEMDLSSSKQLVQVLFPGARIGGGDKNTPPDPLALQVQDVFRSPVSSYQKVSTLLNLARSLPLDRRRLPYAGAAFACGPQEFQQLMLPLIWDPATPADQAQVLAGGVIGLPDPVRLPICLTFLQHRDESIRMTGESVLAAYFPDAEAAAYPALVQSYLRNSE